MVYSSGNCCFHFMFYPEALILKSIPFIPSSSFPINCYRIECAACNIFMIFNRKRKLFAFTYQQVNIKILRY